jgi:hypothetical protein
MAQTESRPKRWGKLSAQVEGILDDIQAKLDQLEEVCSEWRDLQGEYQEWYDSMPDSLQSSPTGEKLSAIADLDLEPDIDILSDMRNMLGEAEAVELPSGFGRD